MDLLWVFSVLCLLCLCARLFICALWSPAGKRLTTWLSFVVSTVSSGFYRTQYPASYTHKSLGRTPQFTLPAYAGTQTCLLCLSLKSPNPKLFRKDSVFPIFTAYL